MPCHTQRQSLHSSRILECVSLTNQDASDSFGAPASDATEPHSYTRWHRAGSFSYRLLPLLAIMLFAMVSTAVASATPTPTQTLKLDSIAGTNLTGSALPTAVPALAPHLRGFQQLAAAAAASVSSSSSSSIANHNLSVQVSQPTMCDTMNITFDPSRGTPPYTVMITFEDYWPVTVSLPASYDDASKDLWLYQFAVPTFSGNLTNPNVIVSVTDSTGLMSNSSSFFTVDSPKDGVNCSALQYQSSFYFYTERPPSMCQDYQIFWNGSYTAPMTAVFLPESAPPIYVPAPSTATNNLTWQVAIEGGTRFIMSLADSRASNGSGGVSRMNIVALNEYFSDTCIKETTYQHRVFAPTTTASPASIFPDATSTVASLTTNKGQVATVTVIETIKNGRYVHGNNNGGLSSVRFLVLMVVIFVTIGVVGVALGWFCFKRHQKRKHNIKAWDLPNNDPSVPFSADPNMPIAPDVFGRSVTRQDSTAANARTTADRTSISGASNYDPVSLTSRPLTHAPSTRASLRSWTSSAFDHLHIATGTQGLHQQSAASAGDYALTNTGPGSGVPPSEARTFSYGQHARTLTVGTMSNGSRDGLSPTDSISRAFTFYSDDVQRSDFAGHAETRSQLRSGGRTSSDGASAKSQRVGPGPTYRPDAASQAAYQDLLASNASPTSGIERTFPFSAIGVQTPSSNVSTTSRANGWAEISDSTYNSAHIVRHADAGLLLDDDDNGDELINLGNGRLMELPPQYDTIHPSTESQQRSLFARGPSNGSNSYASRTPSQRSRSHAQNMASVDIADVRNRPAEVHAADLVDENDDESAFWAH
uniref:Transmembrane protein n=1 Tax=Melanopsichium pennsylvanicum 4 TaxID=1398559 RepID=A0A077RCN7_9BASI|nr:conserved hypothetical protein [Melanopsichium pennsylvanicum 4]